MASNNSNGRRTIWTYAYEILPSQARDRLHGIRNLLKAERTHAQGESRTWVARLFVEQRISHILVVSDSPEQDREINRRVEAALAELEVGFSITPAVAVDGSRSIPPKH